MSQPPTGLVPACFIGNVYTFVRLVNESIFLHWLGIFDECENALCKVFSNNVTEDLAK